MAKIQNIIPSRVNLLIAAAVVAGVLGQLALPLMLRGHGFLTGLVFAALLPVNVPFWSLIHEAVHRHLFYGRKANEVAGRALSVLFGIPFSILRFGHLMHHQYNREWETEMYGEGQTKFKAVASHYFKMLGGLYLGEVLAGLAIALAPRALSRRLIRFVFADPRHLEAALRSLLSADNVRRIRIDCACIAVLYAAAFAVAGPAWPVPLLAILGRAFMVSILDNAYHYGTPADNSVPALELQLPRGMARFILHFNLHQTHHNNPALSWHLLPAEHAKHGGAFSMKLGEAVLAQFRGPIHVPGRENFQGRRAA